MKKPSSVESDSLQFEQLKLLEQSPSRCLALYTHKRKVLYTIVFLILSLMSQIA